MRKIKVITDEEHENIGGSYSIKSSEEKINKEYLDYIQVIKDLKETGYFTEEEFSQKAAKLKKYYER